MGNRWFWVLLIVFWLSIASFCNEACTVVPVIDTTVINCEGCK